MKIKNMTLALGLTGLGVLTGLPPAQALTFWNWSYTAQDGTLATGTFTADNTIYATSTIYTISAITGTRGIESITGLDTAFQSPDNTFEWDGTHLIVDNNGFSYDTSTLQVNGSNQTTLGYGQIDTEVSQLSGNPATSQTVTSSSLSPSTVPFDFSLEQGVTMGVSFFIGLRVIKKRLASAKSSKSKKTE